MVSGYFSHRYSHPVSEHESPWLWAYREHLNSLPDQESGLLAEIEFCSTYFARLRNWNYENPNILEVRYETLIADPLATLTRVFRFLGVSIPPFAPLRLAQAGGNLALQLLDAYGGDPFIPGGGGAQVSLPGGSSGPVKGWGAAKPCCALR